jgi:ABC-type ATPase involved in cell division
MISFSQVTKRYPSGLEALKGVTLTIEAGELVFITGHSGAGKSTLLKLAAAIERPSSGSVIVNGQNVGALRARAVPFLRRNFGLIFQDQKLLFDRSAFDNVMLPLAITGFERREAARRARAALDKQSRAPSCTVPPSWLPTSPPATSTPPTPPNWASCFGRSTRSASPWSSRPTTKHSPSD